MKKINFLKGMLVVAILFIANLTVFAGNPGDNLIYNAVAESAHGIGKQFDVGIRGGEFVKVCIEYGMNHGKIFFSYDVRFWG